MSKDTLTAILADAAATVADSARKAAAVVKPHVTLDNAQKVAGIVNSILDAKAKIAPRKP